MVFYGDGVDGSTEWTLIGTDRSDQSEAGLNLQSRFSGNVSVLNPLLMSNVIKKKNKKK